MMLDALADTTNRAPTESSDTSATDGTAKMPWKMYAVFPKSMLLAMGEDIENKVADFVTLYPVGDLISVYNWQFVTQVDVRNYAQQMDKVYCVIEGEAMRKVFKYFDDNTDSVAHFPRHNGTIVKTET